MLKRVYIWYLRDNRAKMPRSFHKQITFDTLWSTNTTKYEDDKKSRIPK